MSTLAFDEKAAARLEALYQTADARRRRALVHAALDAQPGDRILDLGCGPGFFVEELAERVGPGGSVVAVDGSPQMLAVAARRCEGRANVSFHEGDATALPVGDGGFDRALCVQVLEYVPDTAAALRELRRALRPGGRLVVWDTDWGTVSWRSHDPDRMERVLSAWDRHLVHPSLPQTFLPLLRDAGFEDIEVQGHVFVTAEYTPESFGVAAIGLIEAFVGAQGDVGRDVAKAWADEQRALGERGEFFFAGVQFCAAATRPG